MKWINVNDDLPKTKDFGGLFEESDLIVVRMENGEQMTARFSTGEDEKGIKWFQWYNQQYDDAVAVVTHWLELPELIL